MQHQTKTDLDQSYTVVIRPIHDAAQKKSILEAIARIEEMDKHLIYFYETISTGYQAATHLLTKMQKAQLIKEEPLKDKTDQSVITYLDLLRAIKLEVERERIILETLASNTEEKTIEVYEPAPEDFNQFLAQKVKNAKVQTKKIESSLRVSFSRYQHWITQTLNRLHHLQKVYGA